MARPVQGLCIHLCRWYVHRLAVTPSLHLADARLLGLSNELTEGDVVTIFSQYGEPVDVNLPRDKQTGKGRGFGFVMYENQQSTILAVDNLNGAKVLGRTLRVDHVSKYKHLEKGDDGKYKEADMESMNARPELFISEPQVQLDSRALLTN